LTSNITDDGIGLGVENTGLGIFADVCCIEECGGKIDILSTRNNLSQFFCSCMFCLPFINIRRCCLYKGCS